MVVANNEFVLFISMDQKIISRTKKKDEEMDIYFDEIDTVKAVPVGNRKMIFMYQSKRI